MCIAIMKRYYNKVVGANSRLDELQAGLLRVRLRHVEECEEERRQIAARYLAEIQNDKLILPGVQEGATAVWHQFVVRSEQRDELKKYLEEKEIGTIIHCQRLISIWVIRRAISPLPSSTRHRYFLCLCTTA